MSDEDPWNNDCEILANGVGEDGEKLRGLVATAAAQAKAGNLTAAAASLESVRRMLVGRDYFRRYDDDIWAFDSVIMGIRHQSRETEVPPAFQRFVDARPPMSMNEDMTPGQKAFWYGTPNAVVGGEILMVPPGLGGMTPPASSRSGPITTAARGADAVPSGTVGKSWPVIIGCGLLSLVLMAWGVAVLIQDGGWVGWVLLLGGLGLGYFAVSARTASCPECRQRLSFLNVLSGYPRCVKCGRYYKVSGRKLVAVGAGTIARTPAFCVPLPGLPPPSGWIWPRPHCCCVCGLPATLHRELTIPHHGLWKVKIPYCSKCKDGVQIGMDPSEDAGGTGQSIRFASYDFYLAFREDNMR